MVWTSHGHSEPDIHYILNSLNLHVASRLAHWLLITQTKHFSGKWYFEQIFPVFLVVEISSHQVLSLYVNIQYPNLSMYWSTSVSEEMKSNSCWGTHGKDSITSKTAYFSVLFTNMPNCYASQYNKLIYFPPVCGHLSCSGHAITLGVVIAVYNPGMPSPFFLLCNTVFQKPHGPSLSSTLIRMTYINNRLYGFIKTQFQKIKVFINKFENWFLEYPIFWWRRYRLELLFLFGITMS